MRTLFDDLKSSLNEAIAYERGELTSEVTVHKIAVASVKDFSPSEIKQIRINAKMTQHTFAACVGVSQKSVEAWEGGRSKPDGAARRTLGLMQSDPLYADKVGIIIR